MTGTDALHPKIDSSRQPALPLRTGPTILLRCSIDCLIFCLLGCLLVFLRCANIATAADVSFPVASPYHTIHVRADTITRQVRGSYDVLALRGHSSLRQGEMEASCGELILWVEHAPPSDPTQPRKFICSMEGDVQLKWDGKPLLHDARWMGHLFSFQEASIVVQSEQNRTDVPRLDWSRDVNSRVIPAQFTPSFAAQTTAQSTWQPDTQSPVQSTLQTTLQSTAQLNGQLPAQSTPASKTQSPATTQSNGAAELITRPPPLLLQGSGDTLPAPSSASAAKGIQFDPRSTPQPNSNPSTQPNIPPTPGSIEWAAPNRTGSQLPPTGIEIRDTGGLPFPATGVPTQTAPATQYSAAQPALASAPLGAKLLSLRPRSASRSPTFKFLPRPEMGDSVGTITDGVILTITGVQLQQSNGAVTDFGNVTIETDNAVMWIAGNTEPNILNGLESFADRPIELYLEGNIVLHQGQRVIYADRMYYNVSSEYGMVLSAEVLTPVPQYQGLLRLKADVLEQRNRDNFLAYGAAFTSSRLGVPRYWLQSDRIQFSDNRREPSADPNRPAALGQPTNMLATARNNFVYLGGLPITYWPIFATNLDKPSFFVSGVKLKTDQIFGNQVFVNSDLYQLLGIKGPDGTSVTLSTDYLSKRGPAVGARLNVDRPSVLFAGPTSGYADAWFIDEHGLDTIGNDRVNMTPEASTRGRAVSRFRSFLTPNVELWSEVGYISDRNFLEQYFENEWDQQKDLSSALRLKSYNGNRLFEVWGQARVNDFFTETEWLPRADHYWLGQDIGQYFTWSEHTNVGYAHQRVATTPTDPQDVSKFQLLPWETDSEGIRAVTRQELSAPISLGPWKVVPFLSGEAGYWGEDVNNNPVTRLTGQGGVRAALPFWRSYPGVNYSLLDINGMAHKVTLEAEAFYADSNKDLSRFPLYDPLDDNSQEHFRRRMIFNTFGGVRPAKYEERNYALRQGMQRYVTASSSEIVDDMAQVRMGVNQRWQTKRGAPGRERIVDLISLDVDLIGFPNPQRDNFGEDIGAINYDFRYHIGDRVTLLSDGYFDVFSQGLKAVSAGAMISRPGRGQAYLGVLSLEGPISSNVLNGYLNYRLNEKWVAAGGAAWDFSKIGSIGETFTLTRIGESALIQVGVNVDSGRGNYSFNFNIEPRFFPTGRIGTAGGQLVTPAGLFGVE